MSVGETGAFFILPLEGRTMTITAGATPTNTTAPDATPDAPVTTPADATPDGSNTQPERVEDLPEWAQKVIRDTRKEAEKHRRKADEERTQAQEQRLADERKWQELAEQRAKERDEYKPYKERYEALATQQRAALTAEVAKWPAEVKALLPGEDADVTVLADAVTQGRALVAALAGKADAGAAHGSPPKPAGAGGTDMSAAARQSSAAFYRDF